MPCLRRNDRQKDKELAGRNMKSLYALHGRVFVMLALTLFILMVTICLGDAFHNRKNAHLKTIYLKRGTTKLAGASHRVSNPQNRSPSDNTNVKPMKDTNGYLITAGSKRKRNKISLSRIGKTRARKTRGKVQNFG